MKVMRPINNRISTDTLISEIGVIRSKQQARHILVAGGAGFLRSHLCERLLKLGHTVICVDNFSTGLERNISHLRDYQRFSVS